MRLSEIQLDEDGEGREKNVFCVFSGWRVLMKLENLFTFQHRKERES